MQSTCENIYFLYRKGAGIKSREKASELLGISKRSLDDYEAGVTIPSDEVVDKMIKVYGSKKLGYLHQKHSSKIGRKYLPDIYQVSIQELMLKLHSDVVQLNKILDDLLEVASDGIITAEEKPTWEKGKEISRRVAASTLTLAYEL